MLCLFRALARLKARFIFARGGCRPLTLGTEIKGRLATFSIVIGFILPPPPSLVSQRTLKWVDQYTRT